MEKYDAVVHRVNNALASDIKLARYSHYAVSIKKHLNLSFLVFFGSCGLVFIYYRCQHFYDKIQYVYFDEVTISI